MKSGLIHYKQLRNREGPQSEASMLSFSPTDIFISYVTMSSEPKHPAHFRECPTVQIIFLLQPEFHSFTWLIWMNVVRQNIYKQIHWGIDLEAYTFFHNTCFLFHIKFQDKFSHIIFFFFPYTWNSLRSYIFYRCSLSSFSMTHSLSWRESLVFMFLPSAGLLNNITSYKRKQYAIV